MIVPEVSKRKPLFNQWRLLNPHHALNRGLIGWWLFNDGGGLRVHDLVGGRFGTFNNNTAGQWRAVGDRGYDLDFDGTNDDVTVPDTDALDLASGTLIIRFKLDTINRWHGLIAKGTGSTNQSHNYALEIRDVNSIIGYVGNGTSSATVNPAATVAANVWYEIVFTFTATRLEIYRDGVFATSASHSITPTANTAALAFGRFGLVDDHFDGEMDNVEIYRRVLTATEVLEHYCNPFGTARFPRILTTPTRTFKAPAAGGGGFFGSPVMAILAGQGNL